MSSIKVVSSMATRRVLETLCSAYEQRSGHTVTLHAMGGVHAAQHVRDGSDADIVVLASDVMEQLVAEGRVGAGRLRDFACSGIFIAVCAGTPHPGIASEEDVRSVMLTSKVGYSTGPSGDHLKNLWERWGISSKMARQSIQASPGVPVGELVARGEVALGVQQLSELQHLPGIEIVGPLPPKIQLTTVFAAGVLRQSRKAAAAEDLLAHLVASDTDAMKRAFGMEPA